MKFYLLLLGSLFLFFNIAAENDIQIANSKITEVTLFFNEAQIFRTAEVQLKKGINTIQINGVSPFIIQESLKISADKLVAINGISIETDEATNEINRELISPNKASADSLGSIKDSLTYYQSYREILFQQKMFIKNNRLSAQTNEFSLAHNLADFQKNLLAYEQKYMELENKIIANSNIVDQLKSRMQDLKTQSRMSGIQKNKSKANKLANLSYHKINLVIQSEQVQSINLTADYLVKNASWEPVYDMLFSTYSNQPKIIYKAKFHQNTGLDGCQLNLFHCQTNKRQTTS